MAGLAYDFLANPLEAVRSTFEKAIASGSNPASFDGKDWGAIDLFRNFLFDQAYLIKAPILNHTTIKWLQPNTLVRFRGMIQDMLGNEFYVGAYKDEMVWRTNKFMDTAQGPMAMGCSPDMRIWQRRLLYCVPVPGQNSWTESAFESVKIRTMDWASQHREKRQKINDGSIGGMDLMREDGHEPQFAKCQESCTEGTCSRLAVVSDAGRDFLPCLVKIYDSPESDLKLNEVFEFIGVFTFDLEDQMDKDDCDEFSNGFSDDALIHIPSNKVPRFHCFLHRKLSLYEFLEGPSMELKPQLIRDIRNGLLRHLTAVLGNDDLAAHFMLLHLLSKVHSRVDTVAVGKLSLNLTCFNKESVSVFGTRIRSAMKSLVPFTHYIPLTVEYLNTSSLAPKKDYETNRLISGVLQLPEGTHLIVDETQLEAGTLNEVGVENARLLKSLTELQQVEYDFKYYKTEVAADIQLLILSEGKSHILPADLILPFQPCSVSSTEVAPKEVEAWRWYLSTHRSLPHTIDSEMQKIVEDDLVEARQADCSLGSQDFSRLLTMGRLMCESFGETSLTLEHWQVVQELERLRRERIK